MNLEEGGLKGKIYATLPAGMETTVKMQVGDYILTSVMFGNVDYKVNDEMNFEIAGDGIILFDKKTGKNIGKGTLTI